MQIKNHSFAIVVLVAWVAIDLLVAIHRDLLSYAAALKLFFVAPLLMVSLPAILRKHFLLVTMLLGMVVISMIAYPDSYNSSYSFRLFAFILVFFAVYMSLPKVKTKNLINCIFGVVFIVFLSTAISAIGGVNSVYSDEGFGGGAGGFSSANEYSYLLISLLSIVVIYMAAKSEKMTISSYVFLGMAVTNCFLLTTKASIAFAIVSLLLFFAVRKKWLLLLLILMLGSFALLHYYEDLSVINRFLFLMDSRDIIWALTSGRSERLEEFGSSFFDFIPNKNVAINFEMELFDATINLGIIGFFLVCGFFWVAIKKSFFGALPLALTGLVILIIILSGHFFNAIAIAPYVAVYFRLLDELRFVRMPPIKKQFDARIFTLQNKQ